MDVVLLPGDSALLIDAAGFAAVITPDLREARRIYMPGVLRPSVVLRWPDHVVMAGSIPGPATIGLDLHHVSFEGATARIVKSFALDDGEFRPGMTSNYVLARAGTDIWSSHRSRYRLAKWTASGYATRVFEREPSWFRGQSATGAGTPTEPPPPVLSGLKVDDKGLLWTLTAVAAPTWREAWVNVAPGAREVPVAQVIWEKLYEAIVEVIDPATGRVVARERVRDFVLGFSSSGALFIYRVDGSSGESSIVVATIRLRGNG